MKTYSLRFKLRLRILAAVLVAGFGLCALAGQKDPLTILRLHKEVPKENSGKTQAVPYMRNKPMLINVETSSFLDERYLTNAVLIAAVGGPAIEIAFSETGTRMLEQYSAANIGRRCLVFCQFGDPKNPAQRWIAAPVFTRPITDGKIRFTPDATEEEAKTIVAGLKNTMRKLGKQDSNR